VSGGTAMLDVMAKPYRNMRFIPEGGIGPANIMSYLEHKQVIACSADWFAEPMLYRDKQYSRVTMAVRDVVRRTATWETCAGSRGPLLIQYRPRHSNGTALV
jgi:2-dehydro-3-deoxyphosphogluconate aldolase/(4S)-4-hydroxy-2-oxoglutarate aldolase